MPTRTVSARAPSTTTHAVNANTTQPNNCDVRSRKQAMPDFLLCKVINVNSAVRSHHETMQRMMKENIVLSAGDGHVLPAYRATPAVASRGQLVVLHEFFGLNDH